MKLSEFITELMDLEDELFENGETSENVTVVLPQVGDDFEDEHKCWNANISDMYFEVVDGKKVLKII